MKRITPGGQGTGNREPVPSSRTPAAERAAPDSVPRLREEIASLRAQVDDLRAAYTAEKTERLEAEKDYYVASTTYLKALITTLTAIGHPVDAYASELQDLEAWWTSVNAAAQRPTA